MLKSIWLHRGLGWVPCLLAASVGMLGVVVGGPAPCLLADWKSQAAATYQVTGGRAVANPDGFLEIQPQAPAPSAGVVLRPAQGWNLDTFAEIAVAVRNLGPSNIRVVLRVDDDEPNDGPASQRKAREFEIVVSPGPQAMWLTVALGDRRPSPLASQLLAMTALPREFVRRGAVNGARVAAVAVALRGPETPGAFAVGPILARGAPAPLRNLPSERAFPFIDEFGQWMHSDWPGKIHREEDLLERRQQEDVDLAAHPRPAEWDRFGGWTKGPQLHASGFFRTEKIDGVWWLVDPVGRLFWSHGVVRIGTRIRVGTEYHGTPIADREAYFKLPPPQSPLAAFYGTEPQATRGYYVGREGHAVYDFLEANLSRKYAANWRSAYAVQAQRRLSSWGLNTIANSSDPAIFNRRETPYTAIVYSAPLGRSEHRIEGSSGNWGKLPDPFDPGWRTLMEQTLQTELKGALNDPWCMGFFVDNELHWGDDRLFLGGVTIASPGEQAAKQEFVRVLRDKYSEVAALNAAWATQHASWDALLASRDLPDRGRAAVRDDFEAFSTRLLDQYFRVCREVVKVASPNHLYLGCRFANADNQPVIHAAARHCDVVSINRYTHTILNLALPADTPDRPMLIGEFHFGAQAAGPFGSGLLTVADQADRARAYATYLASALLNPGVVGTHWFQFFDQPTTGRFDGENYNAGLVDGCDTPYAEMVAACRQTAAKMYELRLNLPANLPER